MSFSGIEATLAFIIRIELPTHTINFVEGGELVFNSETYRSEDSVFGSIVGFDAFTSGAADEAPGFELEFEPADGSTAAALSSPEYQSSPIVLRAVSMNRETGAVLSDVQMFNGILDYTHLEIGQNRRALKMGFSTQMDRFFNTDKGNRLSNAFHTGIWPGETGLEMTTGTLVPAPWGSKTESGRSSGGGGSAFLFGLGAKFF